MLCRLVWGEQGNSNALAVAQQLGFDRAVLADAKAWAQRLALQGRESAEKGKSMQEEMMVRTAYAARFFLLSARLLMSFFYSQNSMPVAEKYIISISRCHVSGYQRSSVFTGRDVWPEARGCAHTHTHCMYLRE